MRKCSEGWQGGYQGRGRGEEQWVVGFLRARSPAALHTPFRHRLRYPPITSHRLALQRHRIVSNRTCLVCHGSFSLGWDGRGMGGWEGGAAALLPLAGRNLPPQTTMSIAFARLRPPTFGPLSRSFMLGRSIAVLSLVRCRTQATLISKWCDEEGCGR